MLKLILGRAKSGKTGKIMDEIRALTAQRQGGIVLLVPEQYSHEAETELLRACGDSLSLYAEVLSFTRLASRVEDELGGHPGTLLDKGGRLLCMTLALDAVGSRLKIYGAARRQSELADRLLAAVDELKSACITPERLNECAADMGDVLSDKLSDLALIYEAYDAVVGHSRLDPTERLNYLAEDIPRSRFASGRFYLDGFTDFTKQEENVISALLSGGADVTVCLTCEGFDEGHEIFESSRRAAASLRRLADSLGQETRWETVSAPVGGSPMEFIEQELFSFRENSCDPCGRVSIVRADSVSDECENAAARCVELVRDTGCRWRDIAVAVRSYGGYQSALESAFARYGVPLYSAGKSDVAAKPLAVLVNSAFNIVSGGWAYEDVFTYLKTGLAGLSISECDELENYVFLWSLRGSAWTRSDDWHMHPDGFSGEYTDEVKARLRSVNALRRRAAGPLAAFAEAGKNAMTAAEQAQALADFFAALHLSDTLERRADELRERGMEREAAEYEQLWDLIVSALEQCAGILGDTEMKQEPFGRLFSLVLSKYDVGTIPLSLDRVSAGDMDRMRRRHIKHLLILGCDSSRIPLISDGSSILTDDDREAMLSGGIDVGDSSSDRLCHEFALIYNCLSLPSDSLCLSYCSVGAEGLTQPSFVLTRCEQLFKLSARSVDLSLCRTNAPVPAFELAARHIRGDGGVPGRAAERYFRENGYGDTLSRIESAAALKRGQLSRSAVRALYGDRLRLSASRIDKFSSCRFAYFLQYGLRAKPRTAAQFSPPEMGTFMHYVLQHTADDIQSRGGFGAVSDEDICGICDVHVEEYIHSALNDFREKSSRFIYLFRRLCENVRRVVLDIAHELSRSDFRPLDFELDFGGKDFPPIELGEGDDEMILTGIADRVDGWIHGDKLYIRVVDYKTGWKKFDLTNVFYGMGLQMLLYLFALERGGKALYGKEVVPAGVLYVPAHDKSVSGTADMTDEEIAGEKAKALRRSGLLLSEPEVLAAMERSDAPAYIPVKLKNGVYSGSVADAEQLGALSRHIDDTLRALAGELRRGSIAADPYFRTQTDFACKTCDYRSACHFDEEFDRRRNLPPLKSDEVWKKLQGGESDGI